MTSMPASRSARAMILAPRSCPSRPGLATTTRIFFVEVEAADIRASVCAARPPAARRAAAGCRELRLPAPFFMSNLAGGSARDPELHLHVRLMDRADERVGARARHSLAVGARGLEGGAELRGALGDRDVVHVLAGPAPGDRRALLDRDRR